MLYIYIYSYSSYGTIFRRKIHYIYIYISRFSKTCSHVSKSNMTARKKLFMVIKQGCNYFLWQLNAWSLFYPQVLPPEAKSMQMMLLVAFCIKYDVEPTVEKAHPFVTLHQKIACKFPCIQSIWTIFIYMHMPWISTPTRARTDTFFLIKLVKTYDISLLKNTASHPPTFIQSSIMRLYYHLSGLSRVQSV